LLIDKPTHWQKSNTAYLFKLTSDSQAIRTKVTIGDSSTTSIQLLSGLTQGEQVIVSDTSTLEQFPLIAVN
jgi:HlyD family secretion protein